MVKMVNLTANVPPNREVRITLPGDVPTGPADIVVVIASRAGASPRTLGDLLHSEFFGMWRDRTDIGDSVEFARRLRAEAGAAPHDGAKGFRRWNYGYHPRELNRILTLTRQHRAKLLEMWNDHFSQ